MISIVSNHDSNRSEVIIVSTGFLCRVYGSESCLYSGEKQILHPCEGIELPWEAGVILAGVKLRDRY